MNAAVIVGYGTKEIKLILKAYLQKSGFNGKMSTRWTEIILKGDAKSTDNPNKNKGKTAKEAE